MTTDQTNLYSFNTSLASVHDLFLGAFPCKLVYVCARVCVLCMWMQECVIYYFMYIYTVIYAVILLTMDMNKMTI